MNHVSLFSRSMPEQAIPCLNFVSRGAVIACFTFVLVSVTMGRAHGQWRIVASNLTLIADSKSSMCFRDGVLWVAGSDLYRSTDSGVTWQKRVLPGPYPTDIDFRSTSEGVMATASGVWRTEDSASTWQLLSSSVVLSCCFLNTVDAVAYTGEESDRGAVTQNGGRTWRPMPVQSVGYCVRYKNGSIYEYGGDFPRGYLSISTDLGQTWRRTSGGVDYDSYSLAIDSCDVNRIYVSHEDIAMQTDSYAKLYVSSDRGTSWQAMIMQRQPYLCGSLAEGSLAIYAQTSSQGILRSTDRGGTWSSIGGPSVMGDTRVLCAISNNIVVALDSGGNVWRTDNSGGDSVRTSNISAPFVAVPPALFSRDTTSCESITRTVHFMSGGCFPASVSSWSIVGRDSAHFHVSASAHDSLSLTLQSDDSGSQVAKLVLLLDNGAVDTIPLSGVVRIAPTPLTFASADRSVDTLGASTSVPITVEGLMRPEEIELVLHYESNLDYLGTFSTSGTRLDLPGEQWLGRSKLHITNAQSGAPVGYATFAVFNDTGSETHVTFDSLDILTQTSWCQYGRPAMITSTITPPAGCGVGMLSHYARTEQGPHFRVQPNPTSGNVTISSSTDIENATVEVYDMLGARQRAVDLDLRASLPTTLPLPEAEGVYTIVVKSPAGMHTMRVVHQR